MGPAGGGARLPGQSRGGGGVERGGAGTGAAKKPEGADGGGFSRIAFDGTTVRVDLDYAGGGSEPVGLRATPETEPGRSGSGTEAPCGSAGPLFSAVP